MRIKVVSLLVGLVLALGGLSAGLAVAEAGNPHCNGNSDNVHLPNHHTDQNFPACD